MNESLTTARTAPILIAGRRRLAVPPSGDTATAVGRREDVVSVSTSSVQDGGAPPPAKKRDRTHYLYMAVIVAVVLGVTVGLVARVSGSPSRRWARASST